MINWEEIKQQWESTEITFKELAEKYNIKDSTIRSRKNREKWQRNATQKNATQRKNVATKQETASLSKGGTKPRTDGVRVKKNSGNPNPPNQFPKRNQAAVKHGFYSRLIPDDMQELFEQLDSGIDTSDMLWDQIKLQYIAIMRAQKIMYVTDKDEMIKELSKAKYDYVPDPNDDTEVKAILTEAEYEFQFAWERQAQFLTAQSRAISELRTSIKQFEEMADANDERRLKLKQMQLNIDKTKAEIAALDESVEDDTVEIVISRKEARE